MPFRQSPAAHARPYPLPALSACTKPMLHAVRGQGRNPVQKGPEMCKLWRFSTRAFPIRRRYRNRTGDRCFALHGDSHSPGRSWVRVGSHSPGTRLTEWYISKKLPRTVRRQAEAGLPAAASIFRISSAGSSIDCSMNRRVLLVTPLAASMQSRRNKFADS